MERPTPRLQPTTSAHCPPHRWTNRSLSGYPRGVAKPPHTSPTSPAVVTSSRLPTPRGIHHKWAITLSRTGYPPIPKKGMSWKSRKPSQPPAQTRNLLHRPLRVGRPAFCYVSVPLTFYAFPSPFDCMLLPGLNLDDSREQGRPICSPSSIQEINRPLVCRFGSKLFHELPPIVHPVVCLLRLRFVRQEDGNNILSRFRRPRR